MWSGLSGLFGGMFVTKPAHTTVLSSGGGLSITTGTPAQLQQLAQQNLTNQLGALQAYAPYPILLGTPSIPVPPAPTLAAYEEDVKADIETTEEPDGSIVIKKGK